MEPISGGRSSSGCVESKILRLPRGHLVEASRYSNLQLRKRCGLSWDCRGNWNCLATVARSRCFHVTVKLTYWLFRDSPVGF